MLAFVFTQVEDLKGAVVLALGLQLPLHADKSFAGGVDGELAQVADNPSTAELFSHGRCSARAAEEIRYQVTFVAGCINEALQKCFGFLRGVASPLMSHRIDVENISPQIV